MQPHTNAHLMVGVKVDRIIKKIVDRSKDKTTQQIEEEIKKKLVGKSSVAKVAYTSEHPKRKVYTIYIKGISFKSVNNWEVVLNTAGIWSCTATLAKSGGKLKLRHDDGVRNECNYDGRRFTSGTSTNKNRSRFEGDASSGVITDKTLGVRYEVKAA